MSTSKDLSVIGSTTTVSFKQHGIKDIPAKIDTGADSSSLWASDIQEKAGTLSFKLFGPGALWYTGETVSTTTYRMLSVKNSFGTVEIRYKVSLPVTLNGRSIKARFTLSNRSKNRYPILIGRQTLKNKFVVDVSGTKAPKEPLHVLVLTHSAGPVITDEFTKLVKRSKDEIAVDVARYSDLIMVADQKQTRMYLAGNKRDITSYDFVYFMTRVRDSELAAMAASYAKRNGIPFADEAATLLGTDTKAHQALLLAEHGLQIPATVYMDQEKWAQSYEMLVNYLGLPFIFKDNHGRKGRNNFLVNSEQTFNEACSLLIDQNLQMVAQAFIPSDGYYRIVFMGRSVALAMYREIDLEVSHLHRKGDKLPALVDLHELPMPAQSLAIAAAQHLLLGVAGVDILQDKNTGVWYCLEVNNSPQLATGSFVEEKMDALRRFFVSQAGN